MIFISGIQQSSQFQEQRALALALNYREKSEFFLYYKRLIECYNSLYVYRCQLTELFFFNLYEKRRNENIILNEILNLLVMIDLF